MKVDGLAPIQVAQALSALSGLPVLQAVDIDAVEPEIIRPFPLALAREHGVLPLYIVDGELVVAMGDLSAVPMLDDLRAGLKITRRFERNG